MANALTEKQVLKKLGIENFRYLSKDNVMKFASMIPMMDKEVALKALEQYPEFAKIATEAMREQFKLIDIAMKNDTEMSKQILDAYQLRLDMLEEKSHEDLSFDEFVMVCNMMDKTLDDMRDLRRESAAIKMKQIGAGMLTLISVVGAAAAGIGAAISMNGGNNDDID